MTLSVPSSKQIALPAAHFKALADHVEYGVGYIFTIKGKDLIPLIINAAYMDYSKHPSDYAPNVIDVFKDVSKLRKLLTAAGDIHLYDLGISTEWIAFRIALIFGVRCRNPRGDYVPVYSDTRNALAKLGITAFHSSNDHDADLALAARIAANVRDIYYDTDDAYIVDTNTMRLDSADNSLAASRVIRKLVDTAADNTVEVSHQDCDVLTKYLGGYTCTPRMEIGTGEYERFVCLSLEHYIKLSMPHHDSPDYPRIEFCRSNKLRRAMRAAGWKRKVCVSRKAFVTCLSDVLNAESDASAMAFVNRVWDLFEEFVLENLSYRFKCEYMKANAHNASLEAIKFILDAAK